MGNFPKFLLSSMSGADYWGRMDLEMPGPVRRRGKYLLSALKEGHLEVSHVDACVRRVLKLLHRTGKYKKHAWKEAPEMAIDLPQHRAILRKAASEGKKTLL
jgi:beta-glucosidase